MMELAIFIEVSVAEVNLCLTWMVFKGKIAFSLFKTEFLLLFSNIGGYEAI